MKIKKSAACAIAVATILTTFCGCALFEGMSPDPLYGNREELDKNLTDEIIEDINAGDKQAFKNMFSNYAVNYMEDFDRRIDDLFAIADGQIVSYTYHTGWDETASDYGTSYRYLSYDVVLTTRTETLNMTVKWYPINEYDQSYEGICFMYAGGDEMYDLMPEHVTEADGTRHNVYETLEFGLYFGDECFYRLTQRETVSRYNDAVYQSYIEGDAELLASQFCRSAREEIYGDIEKFFGYIPAAEYIKELSYGTDNEGNWNHPTPSATRYVLEIADEIIKEYWFGIADLENSNYTLVFIYCLRDDTNTDMVGLNGILFYPRAAYEDIVADSLINFDCGIYVGEEAQAFRQAE